LLACRWRDGYVRECHGDLHIGNVARLEGRLTAFDCIEFEPKFRWIDVADDAAFLIMDLCANGHGSKAWEFFNAYLEESGDFQGCALTDLYQVHRALVRAKVAALGWAGATGSGGQQSANLLERYLGFADWLTRVRAPRWLILATGVSGSGKSTWARSLAAGLPAIHLRSDIERKRLAGLTPAARAMAAVDSGIYTDDLTRATYQRIAECARHGLGAGCSVIVDATFLRREQRRLFETIARELGVKLLIVRCVAPESVLRERVALRLSQHNDPSDATLDVLAHQLAIAELLDENERDHGIEIDTARSATPEALVLDAIGHEPMYRGP
jgi:predicted kinase